MIECESTHNEKQLHPIGSFRNQSLEFRKQVGLLGDGMCEHDHQDGPSAERIDVFELFHGLFEVREPK
jgi:hypothetical protein